MREKNGIVICNIWCDEHPDAKEMGLDPGNIWLPVAIDLRHIVAIKECGEGEFIGAGKASVFLTNSDCFTVDMPFKDLLEKWIDYNTLTK